MNNIDTILLAIIAGATILNGFMVVLGISYVCFQLKNIWEVIIVGFSLFYDDDNDEDFEDTNSVTN